MSSRMPLLLIWVKMSQTLSSSRSRSSSMNAIWYCSVIPFRCSPECAGVVGAGLGAASAAGRRPLVSCGGRRTPIALRSP